MRATTIALLLAGAALAQPALAKLPAPTPEQQAAAAAKKAQADAEAEKAKQQLAASMEEVAGHWRSRAEQNGWKTHPQVGVNPVQGINASSNQSSASGQPGGQLGPAAKEAQIRSEKLGTAPASTAVKPAEKAPGAK